MIRTSAPALPVWTCPLEDIYLILGILLVLNSELIWVCLAGNDL